MGCNQSSESTKNIQEVSESPKPKLVKYRTLLTGQTIFDVSPSKNPSRANSHATSRVSSFNEDEAVPDQAEATTVQQAEGLVAEGESSNDASPTVPSFHFDVELAAQACGVKIESLLLSMKLSTLAASGLDASPEQLQAIVDVVCGPDEANQSLQRLLHNMGFLLDRSFAYRGAVEVRGYIAHSETDLVLAYNGLASKDSEDSSLAEVPVLANQQGFSSWLTCCSAASPRAHESFLDAFLQTVPDLDSVLLPWLKAREHSRLIITGHGVGGAIATGALAYLLKTVNFDSTEHSVLFVSTGQPKFGDASFRKWVDEEVRRLSHTGKEALEEKCTVIRLVHDSDPAPAGPPGARSLVHVGVPFLLTRAGEMVVGPEVAFAAEGCLASLDGALPAVNHPGRYCQLLNAVR